MAILVRGKTSTQSSKPAVRRTTAGAGSFNYRPPSAEELRERAQRRGTKDSFFDQGIQFFTPKVGDNAIRILPPPPDKRDDWKAYGITLYVHYGIGADEAAYLCTDKMRGEPCPVCEERARAKSAGEEELVQELRPVQRVAIYLIDRDQEGKGPLIWNMPSTIDSDICGRSVDKKTGEIYAVDDPVNGYDVTFIREGQGQTTKYKSIEIARRSSPLSEDEGVAAKWLQYVCDNSIDEKLVYHDYDHVKNALSGIAAQAESTDKDESPKESKPRIALRGSKIPVAAAKVEDDKPTYEEITQMDEDGIGTLGEAFNLTFPEEGFTSDEEMHNWVAEQLGVPIPEKPTASGKDGWRAKLRSTTGKK